MRPDWVPPPRWEWPALMESNRKAALRRADLHREAYERTPVGDPALPEIRYQIMVAEADARHWRAQRDHYQLGDANDNG